MYDGNQLPENLTSNLQLVVSLVYTRMVAFFLSLGGFAAWATSKQLTRPQDAKGGDGTIQLAIGQSRHPTEYMRELVQKRNAIIRGLLAFIPLVFSLAHLYTSSLHRSTIYGTGQVVYGALVAFAALYMGKTLQQLVLDSDHMDTTKAVYESLYMLASAFDRLSMHKPPPTVPSLASSKRLKMLCQSPDRAGVQHQPGAHLGCCTTCSSQLVHWTMLASGLCCLPGYPASFCQASLFMSHGMTRCGKRSGAFFLHGGPPSGRRARAHKSKQQVSKETTGSEMWRMPTGFSVRTNMCAPSQAVWWPTKGWQTRLRWRAAGAATSILLPRHT